MALLEGTRFGTYEVVSPLGAGGMGEVYRARDTRLNRDVAIKVLPRAFAEDPYRLARFEREAELLALLNHVTADDRYAIYDTAGNPATIQLWVLPLFGDRTPFRLSREISAPRPASSRPTATAWPALQARRERGATRRAIRSGDPRPARGGQGSVRLRDPAAASLRLRRRARPGLWTWPGRR